MDVGWWEVGSVRVSMGGAAAAALPVLRGSPANLVMPVRFFESRRGARGSRREGDAGWGHPAYRVAAGRPVIPKK